MRKRGRSGRPLPRGVGGARSWTCGRCSFCSCRWSRALCPLRGRWFPSVGSDVGSLVGDLELTRHCGR